ncbi:putative ABC transporter, substrate-binding protein [Nocardia nova SH22a]|uniref:Putative ABC transporter, substrate-binding protein n=1 Tax=Nocardia nova SH22a TaxID=1415166 RepID=W5TF41_9NOCA|nr:ABC transporter substrate-binding protein [Nocardia nova]AHH17940.1 putative ABC transporter, substrate-binding protein [Nocardia nova SH22a]
MFRRKSYRSGPVPGTIRPLARPPRAVSIAVFFATVLTLLITGCSPGAQSPSNTHKTTITDALGRTVDVRLPAQRVLLGGQRLIYTTALLDKDDPARSVVGWPDDLLQNDPDSYRKYRDRFPHIADVTTTGEISAGSLSAEQALQLRPDVFVVSAASFKAAQDAGIVDKLQKADIPTVVIDYFVDPVAHTVPSVRALGEIFGRQAQAKAFIDYYESKIAMVRDRLAAAAAPPTPTFLWRAPGYYDCCSTFARSNLAALVTAAGGRNLGDDLLSTPQGTLSPEKILERNPAVIVATGANWAPGKTPVKDGGFVALGYDETPDAARGQLASVVAKQPGFGNLDAVRNKRTFALWHHFYDSPYNYLAVEWMAKWLHPELFSDVNPDAELTELHTKFLPISASGTFWTGLP